MTRESTGDVRTRKPDQDFWTGRSQGGSKPGTESRPPKSKSEGGLGPAALRRSTVPSPGKVAGKDGVGIQQS